MCAEKKNATSRHVARAALRPLCARPSRKTKLTCPRAAPGQPPGSPLPHGSTSQRGRNPWSGGCAGLLHPPRAPLALAVRRQLQGRKNHVVEWRRERRARVVPRTSRTQPQPQPQPQHHLIAPSCLGFFAPSPHISCRLLRDTSAALALHSVRVPSLCPADAVSSRSKITTSLSRGYRTTPMDACVANYARRCRSGQDCCCMVTPTTQVPRQRRASRLLWRGAATLISLVIRLFHRLA